MGSNSINNNQVNQYNLNGISIDSTRTQMKTAQQKSIFDKLDTNKDGKIDNKDTTVVNGKIKNKEGKFIEKQYIKLKDLPEGRTLVADENGKQWVRAKDGTILKDDYVKNPEKYEQARKYNANIKTRQNAENLAQQFYKIADDESGMNSMKKMQELLDTKINSKNIVAFLDAYDRENTKKGDSSIIDTVTSEVGAGGTKQQRQVLMTIMNKLCAAAKEAGVSAGDIQKARQDFEASLNKEFNAALRRTNPKDMEKAIDFLRGAIASKANGGSQISEKDAIEQFNSTYGAENATAQKDYKDARANEGWSAKAGDTVCGWFGCNTIEDMDKKLGANANAVKKLANSKTEAEFKKNYKEIFGIDFDKNKIAARQTAIDKYNLAQNCNSTIKLTDQVLKFSGSYPDLKTALKNNFKYDDETISQIIDSYAIQTGKNNPTDEEKKELLVKFLQDTKSNAIQNYRTATNGKTLEQMGKDIDLITRSAFGTNDIVKDVIQFNENQQTTEMVTEAAFEIAGTVALQFVPGLGQAAAARLAVSAARWGTKAVKVANYATKAEKALATVNKFQKGEALSNTATRTAKIANKGAQVASQMINAGVATAGVDLSNGKSVKEATRKALMNMSFAGVGASSSILAPKLMQTFGIADKALATEIAEEIINAAGSYGVSMAAGDEYGTSDAFVDIASGIIISRLSHVNGNKTVSKAENSTSASEPKVETTNKSTVSTVSDNVDPDADLDRFTQMGPLIARGTNDVPNQGPLGKKVLAAETTTVEQSILSSVDGAQSSLMHADLTNEDVQRQFLQMLDKELPSTRGARGRIKSLQDIQTLINSPEYTQMDDFHKQMAKVSILKSNPRIDPRDIMDDVNLPIEVRSRLKDIESCIQDGASPNIAASLYKEGDFETMISLARIRGVDEAKIQEMTSIYQRAQANGCLLVKQTQVTADNIPVREVVKDGKTYNLRVIDCTDPATFSSPELYGLEAGTTAENMRLTVHMNDGINVDPGMTIGRMRASDDLNLSASITNGQNGLYGDQQVGMFLEYDMGAISYASNYAAGTGFVKTNEHFGQAKLALNEHSQGTFVREQFIEHMKKQGVDVTVDDYASLSRQLQTSTNPKQALQEISHNGIVTINGKNIPTSQIEFALSESTDDMMRISYEMAARGVEVKNGFNEIDIYHPIIKGLYVRANNDSETIADILSPRILEYAQKRNLPIIFQRHVI